MFSFEQKLPQELFPQEMGYKLFKMNNPMRYESKTASAVTHTHTPNPTGEASSADPTRNVQYPRRARLTSATPLSPAVPAQPFLPLLGKLLHTLRDVASL